MITTAGRARRHSGRCVRKPWRRRRSARSVRPRRRSSPALPRRGTPAWARSWPSSTRWPPRTASNPSSTHWPGRSRSAAGGRGRPVHPRRRHRNTPAHHRRGRPRARAAPRPDPLTVGLRPARYHAWNVVSTSAPALAPDLVDGLRRLKLAAMRQLAPELLRTAKTQRWAPEELLRTLVEAEISARDASNARTRLKTAAFPVVKTLDEFDHAVSTINPATLDYLASLEWITAK